MKNAAAQIMIEIQKKKINILHRMWYASALPEEL